MKKIFCLLVISLFSTSCIVVKNRTSKTENINSGISKGFNQKLADSLQADDYGMKNYKMVILKTGENDAKITDKAKRTELFKGHFANIEAMNKAGKLILAGPFGSNHLKYRGIFILDIKTDEEARNLIEQDPAVKAGIFDYEILPWYGSAALPMYLKYHEKVAKENP